MKPEYEAVKKSLKMDYSENCCIAIEDAVRRCEALAKSRELTDAECSELLAIQYDCVRICWSEKDAVRKLVVKYHEILARPAEPETVPFDYEKWSKGGWQAIDPTGYQVDKIYPGHNYTMRRKP